MEAKFFIKGPKKSNQSSNLTSQRNGHGIEIYDSTIRATYAESWPLLSAFKL